MSEHDCTHYWIPNSGRGGEPVFRPNRQMSREPLMHVKCARWGMSIDLYEVVTKLNGPIQPVGEHNTDKRRLENMKALTNARKD